MGIPFKLYEGKEANLPAELTAGGIYFCEDSGNVFIDVDIDGTVTRVPLGKKYVDDQLVDIREFIENQGSGIEIGDEAPTKESANVWINTSDEDEEGVEYLGVVTSINGQGGDVNITASDIDAVSSELLAAAGGVATLDESGKLAQMPTYGDVGAAPAGYGLGTEGGWIGISSVNDLDNLIKNGQYTVVSTVGPLYVGGTPGKDAIPFNAATVSVESLSSRYKWQRLRAPGYGPWVIERDYNADRTGDNKFGPWMHINPPMSPGVEYRTTEKFKGKWVYVTLVDCGSMPNAAIKTVVISNIPKNAEIVSQEVTYYKTGTGDSGEETILRYSSPIISSGVSVLHHWFNSMGTEHQCLLFSANDDKSSFTGRAVIKYTKD